MKRIDAFQEVTGMPVYMANKVAEGEADEQPTEKSYIKICSNGIFRVTDNNFMETVVRMEGIPSGVMEEGRDEIGWHGPKLTVDDFHRARNIFVSIYDKIKSECDIQLEWSESLHKIILRLPHQEVSGAHVSWETQDDDPCWIDGQLMQAKDLPKDAIHIGRLHSHNIMTAFWSSTDTGDQEHQEYGIQIVMGKIMTDPEYKCRICYCGKYIDVELHEVVDFPPIVKCEVPEGIIKTVATAYGGATSYTYPYGRSGYANANGYWDSKQQKWIENGDTTKQGGAAGNGGNFHRSYGYGDYGDGYGYGGEYDSYNEDPEGRSEETRRPFDKGVRTSRGAGKRAVSAGGKTRTVKQSSGKTGKGAGKSSVRILTPTPAVDDTGKTSAMPSSVDDEGKAAHPLAYLITPSLNPPNIRGLSNVAIMSMMEDIPSPMAIITCQNHATAVEARRVFTFLAYYSYLEEKPLKGVEIPKDEIDKLESLKGKIDSRYLLDEEDILALAGSTAINFSLYCSLFKAYFPILFHMYNENFRARNRESLEDFCDNFRWDPRDDKSGAGIAEAADLLDRILDTSQSTGIIIPGYMLTGNIKETEGKRDWFYHVLNYL